MSIKGNNKDQNLALVAGFVPPVVVDLVAQIAASEGRTKSQVVRKLLEESPRVKAAIRNSKKAA